MHQVAMHDVAGHANTVGSLALIIARSSRSSRSTGTVRPHGHAMLLRCGAETPWRVPGSGIRTLHGEEEVGAFALAKHGLIPKNVEKLGVED